MYFLSVAARSCGSTKLKSSGVYMYLFLKCKQSSCHSLETAVRVYTEIGFGFHSHNAEHSP